MLLVVVGLLVLVLVILVVVFLSVRSMRDAEEDDYEDRPAARRSSRGNGGDDEDSAPRGVSRGRQSRSAGRRGPAGESWPNGRDAGYDRSAAGEPDDYSDETGPSPRRVPALPRPRGFQHDQDQPAEPRRGARSQSRQAAARLTGGDRVRTGKDWSDKDWSDTDWGGVSDEQYWAELSSDKPLATTARSAQPASAGREAARTMAAAGSRTAKSGRGPEPDEETAAPDPGPTADSWAQGDSWGPGERRTFGDPSSLPDQSRFGEVPGQSRFGELPGQPQFGDRAGAAETNATDPRLNDEAGWPGGASDSTSTAAWAAPAADSAPVDDWAPQQPQEASWGSQDLSAAAVPGWPATGESAAASWSAQDVAASGANWADEPSAADWGEPEHSGQAWDGSQATSAWDDGEQPATSWNPADDPLTSPSYSMADGYASDSRSYRGSHDRARAQQESSPDVFGGTRPPYPGVYSDGAPSNGVHSNGNGYSGNWPGSGGDYPAGQLEPLPELGTGSAAPSESWQPAPVSPGSSGFYAEPAAQAWDQPGAGYGDETRHQDDSHDGYTSHGWPGADAGYQQPVGYGPSHSNGYGQPGRDYEPGHGSVGYDSAGYGYGGDHDDNGYGQTSYDPDSNGYSLPVRDPGPAVNGYGHDSGRGQHSGYDNDRWQ